MYSAKKTIKEVSGAMVLSNLGYGTRFLSQILLARLLAPEIFGTVALATAMLSFISVLGRWGVGAAVMQEKRRENEISSAIFSLRVILAVFILLLSLSLFPILKNFYEKKVCIILLILALPTALNIVSSVFRAKIQQGLSLTRLAVVDLVGVLIASGVGVSIALTAGGVWSLVSFYGLSTFISALGGIVFSPFQPRLNFSMEKIKWVFNFVKKMFFSKSLEMVMQSKGGDLILGSMKGAESLGGYSIAFRISFFFNRFFSPVINKATLPVFARARASEKALKEAYGFLCRNLFRAIIPLYLFLILFAPEGVKLILGEKWISTVPVLRILSVYGILIAFYNLHRQIQYSLGKPEIVLRTQRWTFLSFIITLFPFTYFWSAKGTAGSVVFTAMVGGIFLAKETRKKIQSPVFRYFLLPVLCSGTGFLFAYILKLFSIFANEWMEMLVLGTFFLIFYFFSILLLDFQTFIKDMRKFKNAFLENESSLNKGIQYFFRKIRNKSRLFKKRLFEKYVKFNPYIYFSDLEKVKIDRPIFLLGLQGGGLTLLSRMLRRNKKIISCTGNYKRWTYPAEIQDIYHYELPKPLRGARYERKYRNLKSANNIYACNELLSKFRCTREDFNEEDEKEFKKLIASFIVKYGRHIENPRFLDKSQTYTLKVEYLEELFKGHSPHFLLLIRNPYIMCKRAVLKTQLSELITDYQSKLRLACEHYKNSIELCLKDGEKVENFKTYRFEDLISRPENTLKSICRFLDISFKERMLPSSEQKLPYFSPSSEKWYPLRDSNKKYWPLISEKDKEIIESYTLNIIKKFKYKTE